MVALNEPQWEVVRINQFGDIACPYCGLHIITPPCHKLQKGMGRCPYCGRTFCITIELAKLANERTGHGQGQVRYMRTMYGKEVR